MRWIAGHDGIKVENEFNRLSSRSLQFGIVLRNCKCQALDYNMAKTHLGRPDWCERMSRTVAFSVAHSSMSFQSSGRMSLTFVSQSSRLTPAGSGVTLRPCAKSSIRMPKLLARKAFEQDAMLNEVCQPPDVNRTHHQW